MDFAIWLLFKRNPGTSRPPHILCHGSQRASCAGQNGLQFSAAPGVPGILSHFPNGHVEAIKGPFWCKLLSILGSGAEKLMLDLLLDGGLFAPVEGGGSGNYYQLSGTGFLWKGEPAHVHLNLI